MDATQAGLPTANRTVRHLVIGQPEFTVLLRGLSFFIVKACCAFFKTAVVWMMVIIKQGHNRRNLRISIGRVRATNPETNLERPVPDIAPKPDDFGVRDELKET